MQGPVSILVREATEAATFAEVGFEKWDQQNEKQLQIRQEQTSGHHNHRAIHNRPSPCKVNKVFSPSEV